MARGVARPWRSVFALRLVKVVRVPSHVRMVDAELGRRVRITSGAAKRQRIPTLGDSGTDPPRFNRGERPVEEAGLARWAEELLEIVGREGLAEP